MLETVTLYHVSPTSNFDSIAEHGISPAFCAGRSNSVWLCNNEKLAWALAHVSERRDLSVARLTVFTVAPSASVLRKTRWQGIYQSLAALYPVSFESASTSLEAMLTLFP